MGSEIKPKIVNGADTPAIDEFDLTRTHSEADDVCSLYPLIAEIDPDDWEDSNNYSKVDDCLKVALDVP